MIRPPVAHFTVSSASVRYALEFIDRTRAVELLESWHAEDQASGQPCRSGGRVYPMRTLLAGLFLLVLTGQPISWTALLRLYWFKLSREDLALLDLTHVVDPDRQAWLAPLADDPDKIWPEKERRALMSEYTRLAKSLETLFSPIRWSPHKRRKKQTNRELKERISSLTETEKHLVAQRKERQDELINRLVAASIDASLLAGYNGDIMFDEVVIQVAKALGNTGTRSDIRHAGNPDAGWFEKKGTIDTPRWAHGATFIMATHRPNERRVPTVVLGMSIGEPTGGNVADTLIALEHAKRTKHLPPRGGTRAPSRAAIADMGFTNKHGLNERLVEQGYYLVQDYAANVSRQWPLDNGGTLFNGIVLCPGFTPLTDRPFNMLKDRAGEAKRRRHKQREELLLAGRMLPNGRPKPATRQGRGRPKKDEEPIRAMRVEVVCPAAAGQVRCPLVEESMRLDASKPTVPSPPAPQEFRACNSTHTSVLIPSKQFKQYGMELYGSESHKRLYKYARALNEQWHSQLRADHTGGIEGSVYKTLGSERVAVLVALAVAATNMAMQRAFRHKHIDRNGDPRVAA